MVKIYKICTVCNVSKELENFSNKKTGKYGKRSVCKKCTKSIREVNKKEINEKNRIYYYKNKDAIKIRKKEYIANNRGVINERRRIYEKLRYVNDDKYRISKNIRNLIFKSLYRNEYNKDNKAFDILGCSLTEFIEYLNDNPYNFVYGDGNLDIDHIIPISSGASTKEEIISLNHYSNFQLLPKIYNRYVKCDKRWDRTNFENWLNKNWK